MEKEARGWCQRMKRVSTHFGIQGGQAATLWDGTFWFGSWEFGLQDVSLLTFWSQKKRSVDKRAELKKESATLQPKCHMFVSLCVWIDAPPWFRDWCLINSEYFMIANEREGIKAGLFWICCWKVIGRNKAGLALLGMESNKGVMGPYNAPGCSSYNVREHILRLIRCCNCQRK